MVFFLSNARKYICKSVELKSILFGEKIISFEEDIISFEEKVISFLKSIIFSKKRLFPSKRRLLLSTVFERELTLAVFYAYFFLVVVLLSFCKYTISDFCVRFFWR